MKDLKTFFILILFSQLSLGQERVVCGVVKDSTGLPIPGVSIFIEQTTRYAQTNFDGFYSIKVKSDQFLVFTFIGMVPQRISASKNEIDVILQFDHKTVLSDTIPPRQTKRDFEYATKTIPAEEMKKATPKKNNSKKD